VQDNNLAISSSIECIFFTC